MPSHTAVSVPIYSIQRDPRCFSPLPNEFWPDRWLTQDSYELPNGQKISSIQLVHNRNAFIPFSFGPANCVGKNLALMELRAITVSFNGRCGHVFKKLLPCFVASITYNEEETRWTMVRIVIEY